MNSVAGARVAKQDKKRMAGDSKALDIAKEKGGKKNAAFKGKVNKDTPGASAFKWSSKMSNPDAVKGLDPELVEQAGRGQGWGKEDQSRYDELLRKRSSQGSGKPKDIYVEPKTARPTKPISNKPNQQQTVTSVQGDAQGNHSGQVMVGDIRNNQGTIDISNDNNSINIKEGSNVFNYRGGQGNSAYNDSPMSAFTMNQLVQTGDGSNMTAGAKFLAGWSGLNRTLQKQQESGRKNFGQQAVQQNEQNRADPDPNNMINAMPQYMKDLSTQSMANTFGDPERWKMPKVPTFNTSTIQQNSLEALSKKSKKDKDDD